MTRRDFLKLSTLGLGIIPFLPGTAAAAVAAEAAQSEEYARTVVSGAGYARAGIDSIQFHSAPADWGTVHYFHWSSEDLDA